MTSIWPGWKSCWPGARARAKRHRKQRSISAPREHIETLHEIFHDSDLTDEQLQEALIFVHCLLTGLTIEKVLEKELRGEQRHLRRCKLMLLTAISNV